jgi:adenylate kinase family enzyme
MEQINEKMINAKIYMISDNAETMFYIGSTTKSLKERFSNHKTKYFAWNFDEYPFTTVFKIFNKFGCKNCKIQLLKDVSVPSKKELYKIEGKYIRDYECVNKCIAGRTDKQYRIDNPEKIKEKSKRHYDKHKNELLAIIDCACGKTYTLCHKKRHESTIYHRENS